MPSTTEIVLSKNINPKMMSVNIVDEEYSKNSFFVRGNFSIKIIDRANTKPIFAIFDPITLPTTNSVVPENAALNDVASSGNEVPSATNTKPIINGDSFKNVPN